MQKLFDDDVGDFFDVRIRARIEPVIAGVLFDFWQWDSWITSILYKAVKKIMLGQYFELEDYDKDVPWHYALDFRVE